MPGLEASCELAAKTAAMVGSKGQLSCARSGGELRIGRRKTAAMVGSKDSRAVPGLEASCELAGERHLLWSDQKGS